MYTIVEYLGLGHSSVALGKSKPNLVFMTVQGLLLERKPSDAASVIQALNQVCMVLSTFFCSSEVLFYEWKWKKKDCNSVKK